MSTNDLPLDEAALCSVEARMHAAPEAWRYAADLLLVQQARAALTLAARVAELEAELVAQRYRAAECLYERNEAQAHANALRDALVLIEPRSYGVPRVGDIAAKALASTPAADLAAHDAEVRKSVLMEAATWFEGSGEPIGKATAQFIRALAAQAQEVKPCQ